MSTHKTPNLALHAWEPTDPFTRAEFNDNFTKLDATWADLTDAVGGKLGHSEVVWTMKASSHDYSSSGISTIPDWMEDCEYYALVFDVKTRPEDASKNFRLFFNKDPEQVFIFPVQPFILLFFPHRDVTQKLRCLLICDSPRYFIFDATFEEASSFHLSVENEEKIPNFDYRYIGWK